MPLIAVLENPTYIINIANAIRNANGLGIAKIYVVDGMKRLEDNLEMLRKRKSLMKHSSGAVQFMDLERFDSSEECLEKLKNGGFTCVATSPATIGKQHCLLHESDLTQQNLAIWFGDEGNGLSDFALENCDFSVTIEMRGNVESFNLGTSTGIVLYEAMRQRTK
ncbi:TrmH family RNA methyltransferase [Flavobacterium sp.]|uniref:TrmH family RNA methyltransferase n=1 Tax=Flavobacterium sp. TaxID=239 RepID=UPI001229F74B|nr:TrmH family RNA methyltransferase [Flavobacterium sp.]RZJ70389.1 MAG: TrmH family RNA methyltransferase [Flavobacterium sp.]